MTKERDLIIRGAREHNLKNVNLTLPRNKMIVVTGLSGSGKSSLAFDTVYAQGRRAFSESMSAHARRYLTKLPAPPVEETAGLTASIALTQKRSSDSSSVI